MLFKRCLWTSIDPKLTRVASAVYSLKQKGFDIQRYNLTSEPHAFADSPNVDDAEQQDESVKKSIDQVVNAYNEGENVYFHCQGGSNRTGTVAIGTLLALGEAKTIEEAEEIAKAARPKINVKPEMKEMLKRIYPNA